MTDFSDCINYIDRVKVEFHSRFTHMVEAIAALEFRIVELELDGRLSEPVKRWFTEPYESYKRGSYLKKCQTCKYERKDASMEPCDTCKWVNDADNWEAKE